jgi:NADH:ubiquinone oxidoreductase subunit 5 (subunit L)/multisubunit Na+/H+ antiporter MnhA subunit
LGGLAKLMPLTFASFLIAALAISGVPPLNGFVSKWLIYQAIFQLRAISPFWGLWLAAVMFGSAFTLASFIKVIHAIFLGQKGEASRLAKETTWSMWLPVVCLAALCVIFGLWAFALPLHYLVFPIIGAIQPIGIWLPLLSTGLICLGLLLGLLIYWLGGARTVSTKPVFIGGESLPTETVKVSGTEFYETIKDLKPLNRLCNLAARHWFDLYEVLSAAVQTAASWISRWQDGLIHTYLIWMFAGGILIFYWLLK